MVSFFKTLVVFLGISVTGATIADCGAGHSMFTFTKLALTPDPPLPAQSFLMTVQFNNPGPTINDGMVTNFLTLNGLPFTPSTEPLCSNTLCPLTFGPNDRSTTATWPADVKGKIVSRVEWTDVFNELLLCIEITEKIVLRKNRDSTDLSVRSPTNASIWDYFHQVEREIKRIFLFNTSDILRDGL
jgi:hypothetical protein